MIKRIFLFLFVSCCVLPASAIDSPVSPMNVLFIGNSFTHMNKMPTLFEKIAQSRGVKLNVEMSALSNHTFRMHSKREELFRTINSKSWDYVVLQGFSRELSESYTYIDTASIPFIGILLDSIYSNNQCTNVLLYMTWGYKNGFEERPEISTNASMSDSIRKGYQYISELFGLPIVPVGPVWKSFRETNKTIDLYDDDLMHPSFEGSYLTACTFYTAIFKTLPTTSYTGKASDEEAVKLQKAAYDYVIKNLDTFKLTKNTLSIVGKRTNKGEYLATCKSNYPNASSVSWDFGDGVSSNAREVSHQYKAAGEYWITLVVEDVCGVRKIKRKVKYVAPPPPNPKPKSKAKVKLDPTKKI